MVKPKAIICDIDNTIIDDNFVPINDVIKFVQNAAQTYKIILWTGRPEEARDETIMSLRRLRIPFDELLMKPEGANEDLRHHTMKVIMLNEMKKKYDVKIVIDDNKDVRNAIKDYGGGIDVKKGKKLNTTTLKKGAWEGMFI